jgi:chitin disaccharide deacetylase
MSQAIRRIWLCADDYGMSPGINEAVRELILRERLNATSVMVVSPYIGGGEASALERLNASKKRAAIGLHITLTGLFKPASKNFTPQRDGHFPSLNEIVRLSITRRLEEEVLTNEISTQLQAFVAAFGHLPDFVDGHQHVHLLPQIRDAFLRVVAEIVPSAWVRQCGRVRSAPRFRDPKGLMLDLLSLSFRNRAGRLGLTTNPAFAGSYNFSPTADFARIFPRFLDGMPAGGLIMCHPGFVDAVLESVDPVTTLREREFAFFCSDAFYRTLAEHNLQLAHPSSEEISTA